MTSPQMLSGTYPKQLQDGHIRLLELLPGELDEPIACHLLETKLEDAPKYEALSYVWGDPKNTVGIRCNGATLQVTVNLANALRRLRSPLTERLIWADAICINQNNDAEKNHQVCLMGDIFSRAELVLIWLGKDKGDSSEKITELLGRLREFRERLHHWGMQNWSTIKRYPKKNDESRILGDATSWSALGELFTSPWFSRIWCVQEIILARTSTIIFGEIDIPWGEISMIAAELFSAGAANDVDAPSYVRAIDYLKAYSIIEMKYEPIQFLENTLQKFRNRQATDSRDKIFGILGMVERTQWDSWIQVDYTKSTEELYRHLAEMSIKHRESLAIFSFVEHESSFQPALESWVPRWDKPKDITSILRDPLDPHWSACGQHTVPKLKNMDCKCLKLDGIIVDLITKVDAIMDEALLSGLNPRPGPHPILNLWKKLLPYETVPSTMRKTVTSLSHTLTIGFDIDMECDISDCDPEDLEEQDRWSRDFLPYIKHLFELYGDSTPPDVTALYDNIPGSWENYSRCILQACNQLRIFYTESGRYGVGPACMNRGDVVALLWGGRAPYVLRPCLKEKACEHLTREDSKLIESYYFLGECYIDELMSGDFADSSPIKEREIILF